METKSRWGVLVAFSLVVAATQMVWLSFAPVTTVAAERYGVSETAIGWLANVFVLMFVVLAVPAGFLLDRQLRGALVLGAALTAVGACIRLGGDGFNQMLIGGIVAALGGPIVLTGIVGLCRGYLRPEHRAAGIATATASTWAGFVAAFALSVFFSTVDSLPTLLAVHAGYATVVMVVLIVALRGPVPFAAPATAALRRANLADVRTAWREPLIRRLCLFAFIPFGTFIALTTWTQALLEPAGVSVDQVGVIIISCVLAGVVGTVVIPVVAARRRKEVVAGVVGTLVTAVVCLVLALVPGFGTGLVCLSVAGLVLLPMLAIILELVERHSGDADGVASGLVWTLGNLGGLIVTAIVGFTLDSPALSFVLLGAITLLALPLLARLQRPVAALASTTTLNAPSSTDHGPSQPAAR